jgi:ATP-dependent DNA helicase RecG
MSDFRDGALKVLTATTVVEVGVDVPDATIMVIENAERFGLSQLHQLRGRVGRGDRPSTCLLLYRPPLGDVARQRLETMRATNDGFRIAEDDLRLRGEGELLGTRQHGLPRFRVADLPADAPLLFAAVEEAKRLLSAEGGPDGPELEPLVAAARERFGDERIDA